MFEQIPKKGLGSPLHHQDVNVLGDVAKRSSNITSSSNLNKFLSKTFSNVLGMPPWFMAVVEITDDAPYEYSSGDSIYFCKLRYYQHTSTSALGTWKNQDKEWLLDAKGIDASLNVGDHLSAWWDEQRGAFIPCFSGGLIVKPSAITENLIPKIVNTSKTDISLYFVKGFLLGDDAETEITLYPKATAEEAAYLANGTYDQAVHLWLGLGRPRYTIGATVHNGTRGWAVWNPTAYQDITDAWIGQWQIVSIDVALIVHARVSAYYSPGDTSIAHAAGGYANIWWNNGTSAVPDLEEASGNHEVLFFNSSDTSLHTNDEILLQFNREEGVWYTIVEGSRLTPFELYDDMTPGDVDKLVWKLKDDLTRDTDAGHSSVYVNDQVLDNSCAYGSNHGTRTGAKGWYTSDSNGKNQIVSIQNLANKCRATSYVDISGTAGGEVWEVTPMDDGQSPVKDSSERLSVTNPWNFYLESSHACEITRNGTSYEISNVVREAVVPLTDWQYNDSTKDIEKRTRTLRTNPGAAETGWTKVDDTDPCEDCTPA